MKRRPRTPIPRLRSMQGEVFSDLSDNEPIFMNRGIQVGEVKKKKTKKGKKGKGKNKSKSKGKKVKKGPEIVYRYKAWSQYANENSLERKRLEFNSISDLRLDMKVIDDFRITPRDSSFSQARRFENKSKSGLISSGQKGKAAQTPVEFQADPLAEALKEAQKDREKNKKNTVEADTVTTPKRVFSGNSNTSSIMKRD